mgnify:CR=1 FL=1
MENKNWNTLELPKILSRLQNLCQSDGGKIRAGELQPQTSLSGAAALIKQTEDAYTLIARFGSPSFSAAKNMDNALARAAAGGLLSMKELLDIAGVLRCVRQLLDWRSKSAGIETSLDELFHGVTANKYLEEKITSCILNEEEMSDNASPELFNIRRRLTAASNKIRDRLEAIVRSGSKALQDNIITQRNGRFVVPVKADSRGEIPGLVHDTSASGATVFVEPMAVVEANNEMKLLQSKEADEIERILFSLSAEAADFAESIKYSVSVLTNLDLIFAKAKLGFDMKASVPVLNDKGIIDIKKARHPLLDPKTVVPVDILLGENYRTLVITGPNTGGKTVMLKAIGLLSLMAMCGLLIPAGDNSRLSVFDQVLADIGDEQSIEQSLSTFSSHIKNIKGILETADEDSLVLLDELCSGTDPVEGAALATAILEDLKAKNCVVAATTHYSELKAYALDTENVENASCEFDVQTLMPTYKLLIGTPGKSNAFAIAGKLGIDAKLIHHAQTLVSAESSKFEKVVDALEKSRLQLERQKSVALKERLEAEKLSKLAQEKAEKLQQEYDREIENAKAAARVITDNARVEVNRLLDEMEKIKKQNKQDLSGARAAARSGFKKLDSIASSGEKYSDDYKLPRDLQVGDTVILKDTGQKATVIKPKDNKGNVTVSAGIMKIKVSEKELKLVEDNGIRLPKSLQKNYTSKIDAAASRQAGMEIDVRGMAVDEAELELDRYIDNALLNGLTQITIIHGKGTGALRAGIHKYLRAHKNIRTFRLGTFGEGESGVTIAELK